MVFRRGPRPTLAFVALALLLASAAWYKHVASPRYHTVGRASGLLMGARRSPYLWRRHLDGAARGGERPQPRDSSGPQGARERPPAGGAGESQPFRFGGPRRGERDPGGRPAAGAARSRSSRRPDAWAASIPRPARRDPWAALGPPRRPEVTPWRSPVLAPSQVERAVRKSPQRQQEAASPFVLVV